MTAAARALHFVPLVLDGLRMPLGQAGDLVRIPHPQVAGIGQVSAAAATALREVRDDVEEYRAYRNSIRAGPP